MVSSTDVNLNEAQSLGSLYVAILLATTLWGVSCCQLFMYFRYNRQSDALWLKSFVSFVWLIDTVHQTLCSISVYHDTVQASVEGKSRGFVCEYLIAQYLFQGLTSAAVQGFFLYRIWRIGDKRIVIPSVIGALVVVQLALIFAYTGILDNNPADLAATKPYWLIPVLSGVTALADILIAGVLCYFLRAERGDYNMSSDVLAKLSAYCLGTGLVTSICAVATMLGAVAGRGTDIYLIFFMSAGRLYVNSMLASLNARRSLRPMTMMPPWPPVSSSSIGHEAPSRMQIVVQHSAHTHTSESGGSPTKESFQMA